MDSLLAVLRKTTAFFAGKGIETARLDAELIFAHVLGLKRLDLYLQFERPLDDETLGRLRPLVRRRGQREPLQYILGSVDFAGMELRCDRRALIPRPETEELAASLGNATPAPARILDLGTGSGCLALALAAAFGDADVIGVDASADALELARTNAEKHGITNVTWKESDWFAGVDGPFDLIVSNPPYLTTAEWESAQPEVRDHEPQQALEAGADGLDALRRIVAEAPAYLAVDGELALETGIDQHEELARLANAAGLARTESRPDLSGRPRFFHAWRS